MKYKRRIIMEAKTEREKILDVLREESQGLGCSYTEFKQTLKLLTRVAISDADFKAKYENDMEVALALIECCGGMYANDDDIKILKNLISKDIRNNQIMWLAMAERRGGLYGCGQLIGDELKKSPEFQLYLISNISKTAKELGLEEDMKFIDKELLKKPDFVNMLVDCVPRTINYIPDTFKKNPKFIAKHISNNTELLTNPDLAVRLDKDILLQAEDVLASKYAINDELRDQIAFAVETIELKEQEEKKKLQQQNLNNRPPFMAEPGRSVHNNSDEPRRPNRRPYEYVAERTFDGRTIRRTRGL